MEKKSWVVCSSSSRTLWDIRVQILIQLGLEERKKHGFLHGGVLHVLHCWILACIMTLLSLDILIRNPILLELYKWVTLELFLVLIYPCQWIWTWHTLKTSLHLTIVSDKKEPLDLNLTFFFFFFLLGWFSIHS